MKIKDIMNPQTNLLSSGASVREAAEKMESTGVGFLPVGDTDQLRGTLTDRDIVLRAVAKGKDIDKINVEEILTTSILYCREDQDVDEVARDMAKQQVRRMPVVNEDQRLVGIVTIGDMAQHLSKETAGDILEGVTSEQKAA